MKYGRKHELTRNHPKIRKLDVGNKGYDLGKKNLLNPLNPCWTRNRIMTWIKPHSQNIRAIKIDGKGRV